MWRHWINSVGSPKKVVWAAPRPPEKAPSGTWQPWSVSHKCREPPRLAPANKVMDQGSSSSWSRTWVRRLGGVLHRPGRDCRVLRAERLPCHVPGLSDGFICPWFPDSSSPTSPSRTETTIPTRRCGSEREPGAKMKNRQKSRSGCRTCKLRRVRCRLVLLSLQIAPYTLPLPLQHGDGDDAP